jgi:hypothetical protein
MLTARNVIAAVIAIAVISLISACVTLLKPAESNEYGGDSFGTHAHGQRALYEVLTDLGIPVERVVSPPTAVVDRQVTLVFWKPNFGLVQLEPAHLEKIAQWVKAGGRLVVSPDRASNINVLSAVTQQKSKSPGKSILEQLELPKVKMRAIDLVTDEAAEADADADAPKKRDDHSSRGYDRHRPVAEDLAELRDVLTRTDKRIATRQVTPRLTGSFANLEKSVQSLELPEKDIQVVTDAGPDAVGTITFDDHGTERILAADYRVGAGTVIVVGPSEIADNRTIAGSDNSVLALHLLAGPGLPVVFDEFYHGLTIRGNPLWLFTRPGYFAASLGLLALIGITIWRKAVFLGPPLEAVQKSRRAIGDYVEAMARFLNRGATSNRFLLGEIRGGVLHAIRQELRLPPGHEDVEELAAVLSRREPGRARELVEVVAAVDTALTGNKTCREQDAVRLMQGISNCL